MIVFKYLYYFVGLIFVFFELGKLTQVKKYTKKLYDYRSWSKSKNVTKEDKKWENTPEEFQSTMVLISIYAIFELIWLGIGLFTFNWQFILTYFGLSIIISKLSISKSTVYTEGKVVYIGFWTVFSILFYLFLILNTFHLHFRLTDFF